MPEDHPPQPPSEETNMSERIKRYDFVERDGEYESDTGPYCLSTDVDAIEAENARLRRIVEAGDNMRKAIETTLTLDYIPNGLVYSSHAYDAAKAQATTK